jgi:hypothetical protein
LKYNIAADYKFVRDLINTRNSKQLGDLSTTLPPPGISSDPELAGYKQVLAIRCENLRKHFGIFSPLVNRIVASTLKIPELVKVWMSIFRMKFRVIRERSS